MGVSENSDTPKSSILIGFSFINHPFWGTLIFGNTHMDPTYSYSIARFMETSWGGPQGSLMEIRRSTVTPFIAGVTGVGPRASVSMEVPWWP